MAQVVTAPFALPQKCASCGYGGSDREWWIDTELQIEFFGAVYFCNLCFNFLASLVPDEAREELQRKYDVVVATNEILNRKVDSLTEAIKNLEKADVHVVDNPGLPVSTSTAVSEQSSVVEDSQATVEDPRRGQGNVESGTGTSDESSDDSEVAGLRSDGEPTIDFSLDI